MSLELKIAVLTTVLAVPLAAPEVCSSCFQLVNRSESHQLDIVIYFHVCTVLIHNNSNQLAFISNQSFYFQVLLLFVSLVPVSVGH